MDIDRAMLFPDCPSSTVGPQGFKERKEAYDATAPASPWPRAQRHAGHGGEPSGHPGAAGGPGRRGGAEMDQDRVPPECRGRDLG